MPRPRRSRLQVILDILATLEERGPLPLSRLATHANLPYDRLKPIVEELSGRGLIEIEQQKSTLRAAITPRGSQVLHELRRLKRLLEDLGLDL